LFILKLNSLLNLHLFSKRWIIKKETHYAPQGSENLGTGTNSK